MSINPPPAPGPTAAARLLSWLDALSAFGAAITHRIQQAAMASPAATFQVAGFNRAARATLWAIALRAVLAGQLRLFTRPRVAKPPGPSNATPIAPSTTRRARPGPRPPSGLTRAMRSAFIKQPIGVIAARICHDLGVTNPSDLWHQDLLATPQTPVDWAAAHFPASPPTPRRQRQPRAAPPKNQPQPQPQSAPAPLRAIPEPAPDQPCVLHSRPPPRAPTFRQRLLGDTFSLP